MKAKKIITCIAAFCVCLAFLWCGNKGNGNTNGQASDEENELSVKSSQNTSDLPLNISIYLDLSDRLKRDLTPSQKERDTAIVGYIADYFKAQTLGPQILQSKNCMKVFFYPTPKSTEIATLAGDLSVDMQKYKGKDKRVALENMRSRFNENLNLIYDKALEADEFPGCDIWGFFSNKNNVDIQCIRKGFRNILVILTDGYLYDENHKVQNGDAYSYVTTTTLKNPNSSLIVKRTGLEDLEVRILEVNPYDMNHHDQLVSVLEKWLQEMGVKHDNITIAETALPNITQTIVESFMQLD